MKIIFFLFVFLGVQCSYSQKKSFQNAPASYIKTVSVDDGSYSGAVDLTNYLPKGYVKNGSVDYTSYLQKGVSENKKILMPNFPVLVNDQGLSLGSNMTVIFQPGSELRLKPTTKGTYFILGVRNVSNVKIINPRILGDREKHIGNNGEWGMGIDIRGAQNVTIYNPNIKSCWGDGIYIGHSGAASRNINLYGGIIDNSRRNGVSVISVNGLNISQLLISNSIGVNPGTGIDFEPNSHANDIDNVLIKDLITYNNMKNGVLIHLDKLIGKDEKNVGIRFENFQDFNSSRPVRVTGQFKNKNRSFKKVKGEIIFNGSKFSGNASSSAINSDAYFPKVKM
ncbi:right-handed parallel beta-helix repeat-containing protein [Sphingobacterium multivorum]|uniref:Right-handed parallel beta-helix repeat-containing protein n=1 Tax=Sphingobacterium multivorum TaxID=28454 RepID=A0ABX7CMH0_SPHMU|nr:right-handed parallel beta-helix repeat-containing protein [Sphingobacterium multivorum]QQT53186.1 right-handed parallel beta-helix repeat-containing protein [Sphingobacterium multivorum]